MSSYYQIFLRAPGEKKQFIADIANAAGCDLAPGAASNGDYDFAGGSDTAKVQVEFSHEFDDDYGIPFSQYPVIITVVDLKRKADREETYARSIFRKLAESGNYSMLLVHDLSDLLDRHDS